MHSLSIIGAGSWGTALSVVLAENCDKVVMWSREEDVTVSIRETKENAYYLPGLILPENVYATSDLQEAVEGQDTFVLVVPSHAVRATIRLMSPYLKKGALIVNCGKGLEEGTMARISTVLTEEAPDSQIAVLSGPNHAEEVSKKIPSATVVSAKSREVAERVQDIFMTPFFRVYTNHDLIGVELAGALKNVIAVGAGISDGLGFGDNTKAALMTRGITEIARLGKRMGAEILTFAGLAGIGDLVVTCTSRHSRNRSLGYELGKGRSLPEILEGMRMVAEGVRTTQVSKSLAEKYGVEMPIASETYSVLFEGKNAREAVDDLMQRGPTNEKEDILAHNDSWNPGR